MLEIKVHRVGKKPARISKGAWKEMIYTRRGHGVQMREKALWQLLIKIINSTLK